MSSRLIDMTGKKCGHLKVVRISENKSHGQAKWVCLCDCGSEKEVAGRDLRTGHTKSCGCKSAEMTAKAISTHGMSGRKTKAPEYRIWSEMHQRCSNKNCNRWDSHGGRGIKVCERWHEFSNFIADMGVRSSRDLSLDRIDNNGDYCPENCRWATRKEQGRNKRTNRWIVANGMRKTLAQWVEETGLVAGTILYRLKRGKTPEQALELANS